MYDCIVIGAGAAGIMAAIAASEKGYKVIILEKNGMIGKKIRITGKGRCNLTNECTFDELLENIPGNGKFLYSTFSKFSNYDVIDFFEKLGLETITERGKRVFPKSGKAIDVVNCLNKEIERLKIEVKYNHEVKSISYDDNTVNGVWCKDTFFPAKNVIVATGGLSYPGTGSTGDGYKFAKDIGHTVIPTKPSLVSLVSSDKWVKNLQGLSLKNVALSLINSKNECIFNELGEMLFTAEGISGPLVLSGSRHVLEYDYKNITASIDLKPGLNIEKLDERLKRDFIKFSRKQLNNSLNDLLPSKLIPVFLERLDIENTKFVNQLTKEERTKIAILLKKFNMNITGSGSMKEAVVTAGGINVNEINPSTMESKICKGLFFSGEVIDVDGYTGGFNLTIAFSTGVTAGRNIRI